MNFGRKSKPTKVEEVKPKYFLMVTTCPLYTNTRILSTNSILSLHGCSTLPQIMFSLLAYNHIHLNLEANISDT